MPTRNPLPPAARGALFVYNLFFPFVFLALLPGYALRMLRRGSYREKFSQRLGFFLPADRARLASREWTWIHSISVGETLLALKLARKIRELDRARHIVLSVTTSTGFAVARPAACDWLEIIYNPLDFPPIVQGVFNLLRPRELIFLEAIWPNLLAEAKRRAVAVAFVPRLSPRSERRFRKCRRLTGPLFALIDTLAVQEPGDLERWASLGAVRERIHVTGNSKFDHEAGPPARLEEFRRILHRLGAKAGAPVLLAGSTFPGEERLLGEVFCELRREFPDLFLIIVPRHVERTEEVLADLRPLHLRMALRSHPGSLPAELLVVDTTGELREWYHLSTVVFIGKSLFAHGGQNPVEPVLAGKPVVFGPHMENFEPIVSQWLAAGAAVRVQDAAELRTQLARLLADPARRATLAGRALEIARAHQGATERTARRVLGLGPA